MRDKRDELFHYQDMSLEELYRKQRPDTDRFVVFERYKPLMTTAALLFTGILLGTVLWVGYPDESTLEQASVPVIQADAGSYRVTPEEPGGMDVPHRDSVIFETMQTAGDFSDLSPSAGVENLLDEPVAKIVEDEPPEEQSPVEPLMEEPIDKNAYFSSLEDAKESANKYRATASPAAPSLIEDLSIENEAPPKEEMVTEITAPINDITETVTISLPKKIKEKKEAVIAEVVNTPVPSVKPERPISFKMKGVKENRAAVDVAVPESSVSSSSSRKTEVDTETIDFVRSVLEQQITPQPSLAAVAAIQPASGYTAQKDIVKAVPKAAPAPVSSMTTGTHYIQLGSLTSDAQAHTHWNTLQRQFSSELSSLSMRVQQADLGARGTYYRVQAGPLPAEQARDLCDSIKAQKPGACLVVGP